MLIENKLRKEVTPKRVFAVLKLINKYDGKLKQEVICELIQPSRLSEKAENYDDVKKVIKFLIDENIIVENIDGKLEINIDKKNISSIRNFKGFCSENIFKNMTKESLFYSVTSEILSKDLEFYEFSGFEEIGNRLDNKKVDKEFMLAWRFWAEFLGFGNIINNQFLANPYLRIIDRVIENKEFKEKNYTINRFVMLLKSECPEFVNCINDNKLSLSLSVALRTLEGMGKIKLKYVKDSTDVWKLYYSSIEQVEITDVEIVRGN